MKKLIKSKLIKTFSIKLRRQYAKQKGTLGSTVTISMTQILAEINQFLEAKPYNDGVHNKDDNHPLVADVDQKKLINIVKFDLRKGKR